MGKKHTQAYIPENLEYLAKDLERIRGTKSHGTKKPINQEELPKVIMKLPRKDRENIERFWELTGGINHSKNLVSLETKNVALLNMGNEAIRSLRNLFRLEYMYLYDPNIKALVDQLAEKINKKGTNISNLEAVKYLVAFFTVLHNGPKMSFEENPMKIDSQTDPEYTFDEYAIIHDMYDELKNMPDHYINFELLYDLLDMLDFEDVLTIKKTFCIEMSSSEIPEEYRKMEIDPIYTFAQVRDFKVRVFQYGRWETTEELILGNKEVGDKIAEFMKNVDILRKDWSMVANFKTKQSQLFVPHELRTLDVYDVGGLEFTDPYEIMFLYLERNIIGSEN